MIQAIEDSISSYVRSFLTTNINNNSTTATNQIEVAIATEIGNLQNNLWDLKNSYNQQISNLRNLFKETLVIKKNILNPPGNIKNTNVNNQEEVNMDMDKKDEWCRAVAVQANVLVNV